MENIISIYKSNKKLVESKSLEQIIMWCGDGNLRDESSTSKEFRELLTNVPSELLVKFINECLSNSFKDSGLVLQDLINQLGTRLGFDVDYGHYSGRKNIIGYDGIWKSKDNYKLIIEVKTTDAYSINLDNIVAYKEKLSEHKLIDNKKSSILIVVGRQDTGGLESQIRGSRHAWNIRLISAESLLKLLSLRETVNNIKVLQQINEVLKPLEYTRIDKLVELIFLTSQDTMIEEDLDYINVDKNRKNKKNNNKGRETPVKYNEDVVDLISKRLNVSFIKQSRSTFVSGDKKIGLTCSVSKTYPEKNSELFWFSFHPYQKDFLADYKNSFVSFGCGSKENIILFPLKKFLELNKNMNTTTKKNNYTYWHVKIHKAKNKNRYEIEQPLIHSNKRIDITEYLV